MKPGQEMTPSQCRIAQHMLKSSVLRPEIQARLDELEKASGGDAMKYSKKLSGLLLSRVYPTILEHFGFQDPILGAQAVFGNIANHAPSSLEITTAWLELETLMRNKINIDNARQALERFSPPPSKQTLGMPGQEASDLQDDAEDQEIWGFHGEVIGVVVGDRIRGGCKEAGCPQFHTDKATGLCRNCGRPSTDHEDKGPFSNEGEDEEEEEEEEEEEPVKKDEEQTKTAAHITVRVSCLKVPDKSISDVMHVELPANSTVAHLKAALSWGLPQNARVLLPATLGSEATQPLHDAWAVPRQVVITEFTGRIPPSLILTKGQAKEAQAELMTIFSKPDIQMKLDFFEASTSGDRRKYNFKLAELLMRDAYPLVSRKFGLPEGGQNLIVMAIQHYSADDIGIVENWVKLETLLRRKETVAMAEEQLKHMRAAFVGDRSRGA